MKNWCYEKYVIPSPTNVFDEINSQLLTAWNNIKDQMNCKIAAELAICNFVNKKYIHNDLDWRHVGLIPIFNNNNVIISYNNNNKSIKSP
jgi:hypothetical protein